MAKFKTTIGKGSNKGATAGAQPQAEPQPEPPKAKERKAIHPGLAMNNRCLKCGTFLAFHEPSLSEATLTAPFGSVALAFCECGIWTRDQKARIRWIRYSSGQVTPGDGEVFAP
jgi:hypothetical protein